MVLGGRACSCSSSNKRRSAVAGAAPRCRRRRTGIILVLLLLMLISTTSFYCYCCSLVLVSESAFADASSYHMSPSRPNSESAISLRGADNHDQYDDPAAEEEPKLQSDTLTASSEAAGLVMLEPYNPTVFGAILRGELTTVVLDESESLLAFRDHRPRAKFHALVIPKQRWGSVHDLTVQHIPLLHEMKHMALKIYLQHYYPTKVSSSQTTTSTLSTPPPIEPLLVFHVPPFHSVHHLHLHVLDRKTLDWWGTIKYHAESIYCTSWETVLQRLEQQQQQRNPEPPVSQCSVCLWGTCLMYVD